MSHTGDYGTGGSASRTGDYGSNGRRILNWARAASSRQRGGLVETTKIVPQIRGEANATMSTYYPL